MTEPLAADAIAADLGVSHREAIEAVFSNPDLYTLFEDLVPRDPTRGGRPQCYPDYLVLAVDALAAIYTSLRAAVRELRDPIIWNHVRTIVQRQLPDAPAKWLSDSPPSRTWYYRRRDAITDQGTALETLRIRFQAAAVETAREIGFLDPQGPGSLTHPDPSRLIYHDGKVLRPLYNGVPGKMRDVTVVDDVTGEVVIEQREVRFDPDAKPHITGDKRYIHGIKYWAAHVRGFDRYSRVTLAVDHVPDVKGEATSEADIATKNLLDLAPLTPGAHGAICDTVLRGKNIDELERKTGWLIINPVTAERVDPKTGERTEKERYVRTVAFEGRQETREVEVWYSGGRLCRLDYTDDGRPKLFPLERVGNLKRQNDDGTFRTYVEYRVPHPSGGQTQRLMEPTYNTAEDTFNRAENIRQIPPGDPDYERLKGLRSDAEAANRQIDDALYLRRARSVGAPRQLLDLLAHGLVQNSIARHRHRLRAGAATEMAA